MTYNKDYLISFIKYDPYRNCILFIENRSNSLYSFEIETGKTKRLRNIENIPQIRGLAYEPVTGQLLALTNHSTIYKYPVKFDSNDNVDSYSVINMEQSSMKPWYLAVDSCEGYVTTCLFAY